MYIRNLTSSLVFGIATALILSSSPLRADISKPVRPAIELLKSLPQALSSSAKREAEPQTVLAETKTQNAESDDPRTRLMSSSSKIGYGANTTGGTNYVYARNFEELRDAVSVDGNYVLLHPSLTGGEIGFPEMLYPTNNITLDGSLAPGCVLFPDYDAGFPANSPMIQNSGDGGVGNKIFYSLTLDGRREYPYNAQSRSGNVGGLFIREGENYWVHKLEIRGFWDDAILSGMRNTKSAHYITISNSRIHSTDKGYTLYNVDAASMGRGYVTAFGNEWNGAGRNPNNRGAENLHFFNNWVHDWRWMAAGSVGTGAVAPGNRLGSRTTDSVMLSENNVYEATNPTNNCAERTDPDGITWGGWIYSNGGSIFNGTTICGRENYVTDNSKGPGKPNIPYEYNLLPSDQVKEYVTNNAGPLK